MKPIEWILPTYTDLERAVEVLNDLEHAQATGNTAETRRLTEMLHSLPNFPRNELTDPRFDQIELSVSRRLISIPTGL